MRKHVLLFFFSLLALLSVNAFASDFVAGKDYKKLTVEHPPLVASQDDKIIVVEFFSFACHWCALIEPELEAWRDRQGEQIEFVRVPVTFSNKVTNLAKAYYTMQALGKERELSKKLFEAYKKQPRKLMGQVGIADFFKDNGVKSEDFVAIFEAAPSMVFKLNQSHDYTVAYKVMATPTLVVGNQYYVDTAMAKGDPKRLFETVDYLMQLVKEKMPKAADAASTPPAGAQTKQLEEKKAPSDSK